jgi:hypothetical protein
MKKFLMILAVAFAAIALALPALALDAAATAQESVKDILNEALTGIISLFFLVVAFYVRKGINALTTKFHLEQFQASLEKAAEDAIHYAEEWGRKKALESGIAVKGQEKFDRAYAQLQTKFPGMATEEVKAKLVAQLSKAREKGFSLLKSELEEELAKRASADAGAGAVPAPVPVTPA